MCSGHLKTVLLAAASGFCSGCATLWLFVFLSPTSLDFCGMPFVVATTVSFWVSRHRGWLKFTPNIRRYFAAGILIVSIYPLTLWIIPLAEAISSTQNHPPHPFTFWSDWVNMPAMSAVVIVCVTITSLALWIVSGKWSMKAFFLLIIGAIGVGWIALALTLLLADFGYSVQINSEDWTFVGLVMILGETSFGAVSAEWIASDNRTSPMRCSYNCVPKHD
jgi:hypothetical protein